MKSVTKTIPSGTATGVKTTVGLTAAQRAGLYAVVFNGTILTTSDNAVYGTFTNAVCYVNATTSSINSNSNINVTATSGSGGNMYYSLHSDQIYTNGSNLKIGTMTATLYYFE